MGDGTTYRGAPLLTYYGGKARLVPQLLPLLPKHTVYVEPYCGGGALFFAKPTPRVSNADHYREVLNDHDEGLITLYRVCQTQRDAFTDLLMSTPYSESEHRKAAAILHGSHPADALWRAWAYYVNMQQSFSNNLGHGWGRGVWGRNHPATWAAKVQGLSAVLTRLQQAYISCTDACSGFAQKP